jgi:hypothetical protein
MSTPRQCAICGRDEGVKVDRCGRYDGVPLGSLAKCPTCRRLACPDCLGEDDCCFVDHELRGGDETEAPPGWEMVTEAGGTIVYQRMELV